MPVHRTGWGEFPNVCVHTNIATMRLHPAYAEAKEGDFRAARRVVGDLFKPGRTVYRSDFIAPVVQLDVNERWNALPLAFAIRLAEETGARVVPTIVQANVVHHTSAGPLHRLLHQPVFAGKVPSGTYVIMDDVVTQGSTLANLRGHIEHHGGRVLGATTLAAGMFAARMRPDRFILSSLERRFGHELSLIPQTLGFPVACLTLREGYFLNRLENLVCLRDACAPALGIGKTLLRADAAGNAAPDPHPAGRGRVAPFPSL